MNAGKVLIDQIFNRGRELQIPFYQRAYVWDLEQWSRLLEDLEYVSESGQPYFMGTIILKNGKTMVGESVTDRRIVIDGQQRLTTLVLFFKAFFILKDDNSEFDICFKLRDKTSSLSLKLGINDKDVFDKIGSFNENKHANDNSQIAKAYNYFLDNINLTKLNENTIRQNLQFVCIEIDAGEDEQKIFDTINSLGVRLTTAELLKNYFYSQDDIDLYKKTWVELFEKDDDTKKYWDSECSSGSKRRAMIDMFFSSYFQLFVEDPQFSVSAEDKIYFSRVDSLFSSYKQFIQKYCNNDKNVILKDLFDSAKLFRELFNQELLKETSPAVFGKERINVLIFGMDNTTIIPYILYFEQHNKSEEDKSNMYRLIESFYINRMITKDSNKNYNKQFMSYVRRGIYTSDKLEKELQKTGEFGAGMPSDGDLLQGFKTSKLTNKQTKGILYLLETALFKEGFAVMPLGFNSYSLEHLMPKKWRNHWGDLDDDAARERDTALLTLGNLTIIPQKLNTSIMDSEWSVKKSGKNGKFGLEKCAKGLSIMENVLEKQTWDEKSIEERAEWLFEKATQIWGINKTTKLKQNSGGTSASGTGDKRFTKIYDSSQFSFSSKPVVSSEEKAMANLTSTSNKDIVSTQCPFHADYLNASIDILKCFNFKPSDIEKIKGAGIFTLIDLYKKNNIVDATIHNWDIKSKSLEQLNLSAETLFIKIIDYEDSNDNPDLSKIIRRYLGDTLEMIGKDTGLTRERVRQIEGKYLEKKEPLLKILVNKAIKDDVVSADKLFELIRSEKAYDVLIYFLSYSDEFECLPSASWFIKKGNLKSVKDISNIVEEYIKECTTITDDYKELIELLNDRGYDCINSNNIVDTLLDLGYKINNKTVSSKKLSLDMMYSIAVRDIFPDGIDTYDAESLNKLIEYGKKEFGIMPKSTAVRSVSAHLDRALVQCGRGKSIHPDRIVINYDLVEEIIEYIDNNEKNDIYFSEIYEVFKDKLRESGSNVNNQYFVHGVINYYVPGRYATKRDYLVKDTSIARESVASRIEKYIIDKGRPVKRDEIQSDLGITIPTLNLAFAQSKDVFLWDVNTFYSYTLLNQSKEDIDYLRNKLIELAGDRGITSSNLLYRAIETEKPGYLKSNRIDNQNNLHFVCSGLFENDERFSFYKPIVFTDYFKGFKCEGIIKHLFSNSNKIRYKDYLEKMSELFVSRGSIDAIFGEITSDWYFDGDVFVNSKVIEIDNEKIGQIDAWAKEKSVNGMLRAIDISDFDGLPDIGYKWNYEMLMSVLELNSKRFIVLRPNKISKQSGKVHAVAKNLNITTFAQSVRKLLVDKGLNSISQSELYHLLRNNDMINKNLPAELFQSECLVFNDGYFTVTNN